MTPEEQNIEIAKACGYEDIRMETLTPPGVGGGMGFDYEAMTGKQPMQRRCQIPDYTGDLNACAEMERSLILGRRISAESDFNEYALHLRAVTLRDGRDGSCHYERLICATAPQRCEAFLRTKGLWK